MLGAFTILATVLLIVEMLVAMFLVHLSQGLSFIHIVGQTAAGPQYGLPGTK